MVCVALLQKDNEEMLARTTVVFSVRHMGPKDNEEMRVLSYCNKLDLPKIASRAHHAANGV